jgi:Zn-dependent membrane-bound protease, M50 family protein
MSDINVFYIFIVFCIIILSMTLHEAMHAFVSYWQGDDTAKQDGRLTLNPIKHIDPIMTIILPIVLYIFNAPIFGGAKPVLFNLNRLRNGEWSVALIALVGPLTNLVIAFILFGILALLKVDPNSIIGFILSMGVRINLGFFVFNMIPIPPLDGSRVLYVLAPDFVRRVMDVIEQYGIIVVFAIVMISSYTNVLELIIGNAINLILSLFSSIFGI